MKKRSRKSVDSVSGCKDIFTTNELLDSNKHQDLAFLSLNTILVATNNLSSANKIGQGGFGSVYKVEYPSNSFNLKGFLCFIEMFCAIIQALS